MPNLAFARESLSPALWDEITPLLVAHWKEIAHYEDIPLSPAVDVYEASEQAGILRIYTVRTDADAGNRSASQFMPSPDRFVSRAAGELVGYAIFFVRPAPHYRHSIQAVQDVLFLHPSCRGGTGYKFIKWCDDQLAGEGVQVVAHHSKIAHDFGPLLERQGYECVERIFVKRLDVTTWDEARALATRDTFDVGTFTPDPHAIEKAIVEIAKPFPWKAADETNDMNRTDETQGRVRGYVGNAVE